MLNHTKKWYPLPKGEGVAPTRWYEGGYLRPIRDAQRVQTKSCVPQDSGKEAVTSTRDWARPAFEYLSVSYRGMGQQWPASGIGALAAAVGLNSNWTENS